MHEGICRACADRQNLLRRITYVITVSIDVAGYTSTGREPEENDLREPTTLLSMASSATNAEYNFVVEPSHEYFCPVTFEILKDPLQTNSCCGNHLSRAAAERLEREGKPCPMCKKKAIKDS